MSKVVIPLPTAKQVAYAKSLAEKLGKDLDEVPFTKSDYWKFISDNSSKVGDNTPYNDAFDVMNYFDMGDFS